jgi:DNA-binding response OmpR family regulator
MSILVVDDSRAMRMIVMRELRKAGYETKDVMEAENGQVALERVSHGGVDLVLSDWNMPVMTGMELLVILREAGNNVPFGFVTSESTSHMHLDALAAGADFVVTKPFSGDSLSSQVELALDGRRQADGLGAAVVPENETLASILSNLLGREVATKPAPGPRLTNPGVVAHYRSPSGAGALLVAELGVAVALGAALTRVPAQVAAEYVKEGELPEVVLQNFGEVLNVLSHVVPGQQERWVFESMGFVAPLSGHPGTTGATEDQWQLAQEVVMADYPAGRVGFLPAEPAVPGTA